MSRCDDTRFAEIDIGKWARICSGWLRLAAIVVVSMVAPARADMRQEMEALSYVKAGRMLYDTGDYTAALYTFNKARERAPHKPVPYLWIAKTLIRLGRCDEAAGIVKEFVQRLAPDDPRRAEIEKERNDCDRPAARVKPTMTPPTPVDVHATSVPMLARPDTPPPPTTRPAQPASASQPPLPVVEKNPTPPAQPGTGGNGRKALIIGGVTGGVVVLGLGLGLGLGFGLRREAIAPSALGTVDFR